LTISNLPEYTSALSKEVEFVNSLKKSFDDEKSILTNQLAQRKEELEKLNEKKPNIYNSYELLKSQHQLQEVLYEKGAATKANLSTSLREKTAQWGEGLRVNAEIASTQHLVQETEERLESFDSKFKEKYLETIDKLDDEIRENQKSVEKHEEQIKRLIVYSPVDGIIQDLTINTIGSVVIAGKTVMNIYPTGKNLEIEGKVSPTDIAFIHPGMKVILKFGAYDFSRYGAIHGTLKKISPTTFVNPKNQSTYYKIIISLNQLYVGKQDNHIMAGMIAQGEIQSGKKTILGYLLKPIQIALSSKI
jgi:adhesin transport system membrane fusion protein